MAHCTDDERAILDLIAAGATPYELERAIAFTHIQSVEPGLLSAIYETTQGKMFLESRLNSMSQTLSSRLRNHIAFDLYKFADASEPW